MRNGTTCVLVSVLGMVAALGAQGPGPEKGGSATELAALVDRFLLDRWSAAGPDEIVAKLRETKLDLTELERIVRAGRPEYPPVAEPLGKLSGRLPLESEHLDHTTQHFVYVPKGYDPQKAAPLLVIAHGGSAARDLDFGARAARGGMVPFWLQAAERHGFLVIAPLSDRGWMQIGTSLLFSAISRMKRDFNVDPDRVFLTGHSMGGHLTWRSSFWFTDRWAAVSPMSGGYDYVKSGDVWNLVNVAGYTTFGTEEPYQINEFNRIIAGWMKAHAYPWTCREKQGGHTIFPDEVVHIAEFFAEQRRELYRKKVWARVNALRFETAETNSRWPKTHTWRKSRPLDLSTMHWLRFSPPEKDTPPEKHLQRVFAEIKPGNRIEITSENVRRLRLYLHPKMIAFAQPLTVIANGTSVFSGEVTPDPALLLSLVREYDDRGRLFHAAVDLEIKTDRAVPEPRGP